MRYKYKSPLDMGYQRVEVDKKKWNKILPYKGEHFNWKQTIHVYYSEDKGFLIERYTTLAAKIFITVCYPFYILIAGLENIKQLNKEYKAIMNQKGSGAYSRDEIGKTSKYYDKAKDCILCTL